MTYDTIGHHIAAAARDWPDAVAVSTAAGKVLTYADLDARTTSLAAALVAMGLEPGDRVAAWLPTCLPYVELYIAVAKAGIVLVPVNNMLTEPEAEYIIRDSGAKVLFHGAEQARAANSIALRRRFDRLVLVAGDDEPDDEYSSLIRAEHAIAWPSPGSDTLFLLAYTSGTTGRPKGVIMTHRGAMMTFAQHAHTMRTPRFSTCVYHSNMSFVATVTGHILSHLYLWGRIHLTGKVTPETLLDHVDAVQGNFTFVPSPWVASITSAAARHPEKWKSIRTFLHAGSKVDPRQLRALADVIGGDRYLEGWGVTEGSGALSTATDHEGGYGRPAQDYFASVGRPVLGARVRVLDEGGRELPRDGESVGELVISAPNLAEGYWNLPEATARAFRHGWHHTGDLGSIDRSGYVYVNERRNDLIVSGGMNVYPSEIEMALSDLAGVATSAVVAQPHPRWGHAPVAFIVREPGSQLDETAVRRHCETSLARYKRPANVYFVVELPMNASGKVLRHQLRERAAGDAPSPP